MKRIFILLTIVFPSLLLHSQPFERELKEVIQLVIPREGGANAANVAWHPIQKKYYAAMAGNISFSLAVYDNTGKLLSPTDQETLFDVRGLWYNPTTKTRQMNGYNDFGWAEYKLNSKGFPSDVVVLHKGMNQPSEQSVGVYNYKEKVLYFLNSEGKVEVYDAKTAEYISTIELKFMVIDRVDNDNYDEDENINLFNEQYNSTSMVYTGISGAELGVLNHEKNRIELYSIRNGWMVRQLNLPYGAPVNEWMNFAFANGIYFLCEKTERIWYGYK